MDVIINQFPYPSYAVLVKGAPASGAILQDLVLAIF